LRSSRPDHRRGSRTAQPDTSRTCIGTAALGSCPAIFQLPQQQQHLQVPSQLSCVPPLGERISSSTCAQHGRHSGTVCTIQQAGQPCTKWNGRHSSRVRTAWPARQHTTARQGRQSCAHSVAGTATMCARRSSHISSVRSMQQALSVHSAAASTAVCGQCSFGRHSSSVPSTTASTVSFR
jgi:hypothetical protein